MCRWLGEFVDATNFDFGVAPTMGTEIGQPIFKKLAPFDKKMTLPNGVGLDPGLLHR